MRRSKLIMGLAGAAVAWPLIALAQPSGGEKHNLTLTHAQQSEIWRALGRSADKAQEPAGLHVGEAVPDTMNMLPFSHHLRKKIRALGHYRYALMHDQVLIVDPGTKKIISIVGK